jgi:hypothetical protein
MNSRIAALVLAAVSGVFPFVSEAAPVLSDLELWLRADAGVTTVGSGVSSWADQSGNAHTFSDGGMASQRPTLTTDPGFNGLPVVAFDGIDDRLLNADLIVGGSAFTLFTVARISPLTSPYPYVFGTTIGARIGYEGPPFTPLGNNGFDVFHDFGNDARATLAGLTDGNPKIVSISGNGTMSSIQVWGDGVAASMSLTGADTTISFSLGNTLGFAASCGSDCFGDPVFAEILLYDRALTTAERQENESYLRVKYFEPAQTPVPEPTVFLLLGLGSVAILRFARRDRSQS